ncbi:MAG: 3-hydroxyacyl-CoA dehydrogenase family protein [Promethearchaeota archaeon]
MNLNDIKRVLIVGAGTMGHSIAQVYAQAGMDVFLVDLSEGVLERAINKIKSNLNTLANLGRLSSNDIPGIIDLVHVSTDLASTAKEVDLVVEAVIEISSVKTKIFSQLNKYCSEDTIIASNTSSLNIFKIAKKIRNLERLIIHHWFAPPHIIPLVEIVKGRKTSKEVVDLSVRLMEKLGKMPIVLNKYTDSFIVNKIQDAISPVVFQLILRNIATPEDIDRAVKYSLGIRLPIVGVAQTLDFTGLDLVLDITKNKGGIFPFLEEKVEKGNLGAKSSKGLYDYGGRSEMEILEKRDEKYLQMLDFLKKINAFVPI